jgi:hypothetical protein
MVSEEILRLETEEPDARVVKRPSTAEPEVLLIYILVML